MATIEGEKLALLQCRPDNIGWKVISSNETIANLTARFNCTDGEIVFNGYCPI